MIGRKGFPTCKISLKPKNEHLKKYYWQGPSRGSYIDVFGVFNLYSYVYGDSFGSESQNVHVSLRRPDPTVTFSERAMCKSVSAS